MSDSERQLRLTTGKKKLSWIVMKMLAGAEDRHDKVHKPLADDDYDGEQTVWFSRPSPTHGGYMIYQRCTLPPVDVIA
jgi:hypothetical protein